MNLQEETRFIMKKYGITANKSLGQNFLIDESVILDAIEAADISEKDLVIEIGPGLGTLTKYLLERAGKVICIELDDRMINILNDRFKFYNNFNIINEDVLKVDLKTLIAEEKASNIERVKIVANLPYYITTPIIMKLLEEHLDIESITVMVQKEVAKRLSAIPGEKEAGSITYSVYYYSDVEEIRIVPNTSFIPEPEVESEVIKLNIRKDTKVKIKDEKLFFKIIKLAFMQRRKTLVNALTNGKIVEKENLLQILEELNIDSRIRGEALKIEEFAKISDMIVNKGEF